MKYLESCIVETSNIPIINYVLNNEEYISKNYKSDKQKISSCKNILSAYKSENPSLNKGNTVVDLTISRLDAYLRVINSNGADTLTKEELMRFEFEKKSWQKHNSISKDALVVISEPKADNKGDYFLLGALFILMAFILVITRPYRGKK